MKPRILLLFAFFILISCKREQKISPSEGILISEKLQYREQSGILEVKSGNFTYKINENKLPFRKVILLNASMAGYISELGVENMVVGVSSPEYIYSKKIQELLKQGKILNVGSEQKYEVEKILSIKPDVIFTNYVASFENTYQLLKNNGIEVVFLDEYTEQNPLEKAGYIKLFGRLLGKEKEANAKHQEVEKNYNELKKLALKAKSRPVVLANEMYGDVWYLPGGKTNTANYIADANAEYILKNNTEEKAVNMSFEEVYAKSGNVQYWVNAGNHTSKKDILTANPFYGKLEVFNKGKIYAVNGREVQKTNDFFESGVVRADIVLKDYIRIFHPELLPDYQLTYMKELK